MIRQAIAGIPDGEHQFADYEERFPFHYGCMASVKIIADPGGMVNYTFLSAVPSGNVETSQRIIDVVLGALHDAASDQVPAACSDTMNNVTAGGCDSWCGEHSTYYETIAGGLPVEVLEHAFPFRMARYSIRHNSSSRGQFPDGDGIIP
jgi:N-methylhydantoinase B